MVLPISLLLEKYIVSGNNIIINNKNKTISSNEVTSISDPEGNSIELQNFDYEVKNNIFKSIGSVKILDKLKK